MATCTTARDGCPRAICSVVAVGILLLFAWLPLGCSSGKSLLDDRNPFYLRGLRLRQENKFEEAAAAFDKCLRLSPGSAKAHLQLAMLYEDRLSDPLKAAYHYHEYLRQAPPGENRDMVQKWVTRAERTMLQQLVDKYPEDVDILLGKSQPAQGLTALSAREQYLIQRVRKMGVEIVSLRQALAKTDSAGTVSGSVVSGGLLPAPAPRLEEPPSTAEGPVAEPVSEAAPPAAGTSMPAIVGGVSGTAQRGTGIPAVPVPGGAGLRSAVAGSPPAAAGESTGTRPGAGEASTRVPESQGRSFVPLRRLSAGGPSPTAPAGGEVTPRKTTSYVVQKGDTLSSVAKKLHGTSSTWKQLQDANRDVLKGSSILRIGMVLRVPERATGTGSKGP